MPNRFTDRYIRGLKPREKRYMVKEDNAHGQGTLRMRVSPTGTKTWLYTYKHAGRTRFMTLGQYPAMTVAEAHEAFGKATADRSRGFDPADTKVRANAELRAAGTVAQLVDRYLEDWAKPRKKTWRKDEALLTKKVLPRWGSRRAVTITRSDVRALNRQLLKDGETVANRTYEIVRKMFNWAVDEELLEHSPCARVRKPAKDKSRDRVLSHEELRSFLNKLPTARMSRTSKLALLFYLLTAQRPGEVLGCTWSEIDLEQRVWTIAGSRAKNGLSHPVPLSEPALAVLQAAAERRQGECVFPSSRGDRPMGETALSRAVRRNLEHFGLQGFVPYDLRRTAATQMAAAGTPRLVIAKILNHKDASVTAVYERYGYAAEKREALAGWAAQLKLLGLALP